MTLSFSRPFLLLLCVCSFARGLTLPPEAEVQKKLADRLTGKEDYSERVAKRMGNRTIQVEGLIAMDGDIALAQEILSDPKEFGRWLLPNINTRPSGGEYLVKVLGLDLLSGTTNHLVTKLRFDLPLFQKDIECHMLVGTERKEKWLQLNANVESMQGTYIEHFHAVLQFFPREKGKLWVYAIGEVRFKHWILYEALPDRLLTRETGERLQIAIDNYLNEENHRRSLKKKMPPVSATTPPKKKGGLPKESRP